MTREADPLKMLEFVACCRADRVRILMVAVFSMGKLNSQCWLQSGRMTEQRTQPNPAQ